MSKRMRVYSLETNKLLHLAFARNYVNHLLPALRKEKKKIMIDVKASTTSTTSPAATPPTDDDGNGEMAKIVRFEVNMAMALSAKEFAWSRALEANLRREYNTLSSANGQTSSFILRMESTKKSAIFEGRAGESSALVPYNPSTSGNNLQPTMPLKTSENPRCDLKITTKSSSAKSRRSRSRKGNVIKKSEEENVGEKLANLRTLLPGGNEMGDNNEEFLTEVASYITCLKLQVQVLQYLVEGQ